MYCSTKKQYVSLICNYVIYRRQCLGQYMVFEVLLVPHLPTKNVHDLIYIYMRTCIIELIARFYHIELIKKVPRLDYIISIDNCAICLT